MITTDEAVPMVDSPSPPVDTSSAFNGFTFPVTSKDSWQDDIDLAPDRLSFSGYYPKAIQSLDTLLRRARISRPRSVMRRECASHA